MWWFNSGNLRANVVLYDVLIMFIIVFILIAKHIWQNQAALGLTQNSALHWGSAQENSGDKLTYANITCSLTSTVKFQHLIHALHRLLGYQCWYFLKHRCYLTDRRIHLYVVNVTFATMNLATFNWLEH